MLMCQRLIKMIIIFMNMPLKIMMAIFGESCINHVIIDINGEYGMTQGAMAICVNNLCDVNNIKKALLSNKFNEIIKATMIGNFRIDWNIFKDLRKDFWKEFI